MQRRQYGSKKIYAICKLLQSSIESGLNASLTPDDCRLMLQLLKPDPKPPVDRIVDSLTDLARDLVDDIVGTIPPPPRKRSKKTKI